MKKTYTITGMTCNGCVAFVTKSLLAINEVDEVKIDLALSKAVLHLNKSTPLKTLQDALPSKYVVTEKVIQQNTIASKESTLKQLRPLFLIFTYLLVATFLLNYKEQRITDAMLDFMGLFYIVFSFFKLLDLKGFPKSFRMYDPIAKAIPIYGWVYPFIEVILGILFLMRIQIPIALIVTLVILGVTTVGVLKTLVDKKTIQCACLGTALKLPMTKATFIENSIMIVMAILMLINIYI